MSIPKENPTPIRVMIVDDHKSIVWGLERLVESAHPYMEIAGTANSCLQMLAIIGTEMPDVILLDLDLDGICAVDAIADIQRLSKARVLILTGDKDPDIHHAAFMNGAHGVIGKEAEADVLLHAIERVHSGEVWINRTMMGRVLGAMSTGTNGDGKRNPDAARIASLTPRERDIVRAIVRHRGAKSNVIAETVCISEHTLRNHLTVIYDKLDVRNRIDLYAYATEHGLAVA